MSIVNTLWEKIKDEPFFKPFASAQALSNEMESNNIHVTICVKEDIIAFGMLRGFAENWEEKVLGIWVDKAWRCRGIGTKVIGCLELEAMCRGIKSIRLHVDPFNPAKRLYERLGYKFEGIFGREYLMRKQL